MFSRAVVGGGGHCCRPASCSMKAGFVALCVARDRFGLLDLGVFNASNCSLFSQCPGIGVTECERGRRHGWWASASSRWWFPGGETAHQVSVLQLMSEAQTGTYSILGSSSANECSMFSSARGRFVRRTGSRGLVAAVCEVIGLARETGERSRSARGEEGRPLGHLSLLQGS